MISAIGIIPKTDGSIRVALTKEHFTTIDVSSLNNGDVLRVWKNIWVWCVNGDSTKAIVYQKYSIQGNSDKRIAEKFQPPMENCRLVLLETCLVPYDTTEYYY